MMNVTHQINAVSRAVGTRTLDVGAARIVTLTQVFDATVEDLWDACTNRDRIPRWFLPVSGDLTVGGHYQLEGNAGGTIDTCTPAESFTATWEYDGEVSWIEVRISPEHAKGARLTLDHIAPVDDTRWAEFGPGAVGIGWELGLFGLAGHLESGETVRPEENMEWMLSDDAKHFMDSSSQAWCAASIAAGTDPTAAREAAARTTAAYTDEAPSDGVSAGT